MPHKYIVLCGQVVGSPGLPYTTEYGFDGKRFDDRQEAIGHGFDIRGSDDFNIGVLKAGKLVSMDWMDEAIDTDPAVLATIAAKAGL